MSKNVRITALYCRLSQEDMQAGESESIQNQKLILQNYAEEHHFPDTRFYIDDGFSGVSFEREGLQTMLRDVEAGKVAVVITKDLSRLGRNYLKTGELIEIIFPKYDVRYIAINDGVDTAKGEDEFAPLRNWFNEFYARDTSRKIRAVKQAKAQKGERVNGEVPYGYLKDENDRNHLLPDPETACVVKQIFAMYIRGDRICDIQNWLKEHEIPTAAELRYRRSKSCRHPRPHPDRMYSWPDKTLYDILSRREYLGHTITGKSYKVSYKSNKTKKNTVEKQYFFPNTHEAIIDPESFELARKRLATRHRPAKSHEIDPFSGLLYCGDCGYKMYLQQGSGTPEQRHAYTCGRYRNRARTGGSCTSHYIRRTVLRELVLADLKRVMSQVQEGELLMKVCEHSRQRVQKALSGQQTALARAESKKSELNTLFCKIYEDRALGRLSDEQFALLSSHCEEERKILGQQTVVLSRQAQDFRHLSGEADRINAARLLHRYTEAEELTYEIVHEFIDRILIYETDKATHICKIKIYYSFLADDPPGRQ